ncbi:MULTISPECIES: DNA polymerase III subunit beta [Wolbachia]|jgi:DNA polymerase-3 subunit beta|uniref:Beta sliding clamp n=1 Tax=Wolbachia pipientis TaxID=955 RepID=A0A6I6CGT3_WOLPI|nr:MULTISPECIES: DNA polymerase III subunit beta [Wolbachia]MDU8940654.1 DNA polymerase III subunit beta [Wolbachia endosymbiont of Drosophila malagassya]MDX5496485.1 DNA polymerase III subunit beta [Wolbachia endosymbiont of Nomada fabriciana]MDX5507253.1 DNA polymerase III subunit beta [Wolbachia endosymbiont of Hylaeus sinuatus]MDX5527562.1 DNA polymerase III subunit beta [Wolbachia endosymbiont of Andrena minutula]MEC4735716.1 DNA polymerase III subunit beta [Wolbachia endosymbiont of Hali
MSEVAGVDTEIKKQNSVCEQMRFSVSRTSLLNTLSRVSGVVERRNAIDVLACINIKAQHGSIKLMATDLDISMFASLAATVLTEGEVKISAHTLHDIVKKLPADLDVNFEVNNQGKLLMSCGNANFSLPNVVSSSFPALEEDNYKHDFTLLNTDLIDLLTKTKFAVSLDDTRYNLNGIYLHTDEQFLYCVATDGHRLSCIKRPKPGNINGEFGVIIPRKTVMELLKILDDCNEIKVKLSDRKIKFTCGEYILISKLIDGTFPNYKAVIPASQDKHMIIESKKLSDVIDRVSVVVSDKVKSIKFSLQEKLLTLHSNSQECSDATESIEVDYNEAPIEIGFNSRYLLDVLSCIKNKCKFSLADGNSATIITDEDDSSALYVVMPMRT